MLRYLTRRLLPDRMNVKMMNIKILSLDHVVFNVRDPESSLRFYAGVLGLEPLRVAEFRAGEVPFPSVRINADTIIDFFPPEYHHAAPHGNNVNHIALTLENPPDEIEAQLESCGIAVVREMTGNFGARGYGAHAFHVKDPDGNVLELHSYR